MSYSRFGYADVYVFMSVGGHLECCGCILGDEWAFDSTQAMVDHLSIHRDAGHHVPDIEPDLWRDDAQNFPKSCSSGHVWGAPYRPFPDHADLSFIERVRCTDCDWESSWPNPIRTRDEAATS